MDGKQDGNGRVTLAILSTKLDNVIALLEQQARQQREDHDAILAMRGDLRSKADVEALSKMEKKMGELQTRVDLFAGLGAALITISSAIASYLGIRH